MKALLRALPFSLALAFPACGDDSPGTTLDATDTAQEVANETVEETTPDATEEAADATEEATPETVEETTAETVEEVTVPACVTADPLCQDEQIRDLDLSDVADGGPVSEEGAGDGVFISHIDATAGGANGTQGYTYARFTDNGLEAVNISDEDSLESTDWDIAARRFVLRLNSGVSGPSCVRGGRTGPATEFSALTAVPANITLRAEQYFDAESCEYVPDTSGIGAPQTVLSSYWSYAGCVSMTGNVYVVALANGRHVKLQVLSYYSPAAQDTCDETGAAPTPSGSGNVRIKWAFID